MEWKHQMKESPDLQNMLLALANYPDWVFSLNTQTESLNGLYQSTELPKQLGGILKSHSISELRSALEMLPQAEETAALPSMQTLFTEVQINPDFILEFTLPDMPSAHACMRFSYVDDQHLAGALYYREIPEEFAEYFI